MGKKIELSFIIPAYNEEKIIKRTLEKVLIFLSKKPFSWEVIVVDDGSTDKMADLVGNLEDRNSKLRLIKLPKNRGKGGALKAGVKASRGEYIIYSDTDLSVPLENIEKFLSELEKNDVVIGSRRAKGAKILVHQPWLRENMGRFYTFLSNVITSAQISDFTCGFKGFRDSVAKEIFGKALLDRWAYDSEVLFLANKFSYRISELPVEWKNREDTRVRLRNAILTSFLDLVKIRINDILGKYNK